MINKYIQRIFLNVEVLNKTNKTIIIMYLLYLRSLEGCYEGEDICSKKNVWIVIKIIEEITSCIILSIVLQLIFFSKKLSKLHLLHMIIVFQLLYVYNHELVFEKHGYFNFIFYFIFLSILIFII